tara:strand:- start:602 stop:865 length:264 start_codon:yes stop_codon:yes gene_type:complete
MKVTKTYLKHLIEEELNNINELEKEGDVPPVEDSAAERNAGMEAEDDLSAEQMLVKIHDELMSFMKKAGLSSSIDTGMGKSSVDMSE